MILSKNIYYPYSMFLGQNTPPSPKEYYSAFNGWNVKGLEKYDLLEKFPVLEQYEFNQMVVIVHTDFREIYINIDEKKFALAILKNVYGLVIKNQDVELDNIIVAIEKNDLETVFEILDNLSLNSKQKNTYNKLRIEYIHGNIQSDFIQRLIVCVREFYREE